MRLIDADDLIGVIQYNTNYKPNKSAIMADELIRYINSQPIAYDVDKVVSELEKENKRLKTLKNNCIALSDHEVCGVENSLECIFDKADILDERARDVVDALKIVRQLAAEYNNGWIPCSERLPEPGEIVLVTDGKEYQSIYCVALRIAGEWRTSWNHDRFGSIDIIAWQPLPEHYKERAEPEAKKIKSKPAKQTERKPKYDAPKMIDLKKAGWDNTRLRKRWALQRNR